MYRNALKSRVTSSPRCVRGWCVAWIWGPQTSCISALSSPTLSWAYGLAFGAALRNVQDGTCEVLSKLEQALSGVYKHHARCLSRMSVS